MTKRWIIVLGLVAVLAAAGVAVWFSGDGDAAKAPDVVIIVIDTTRADHMGFLGKRLEDGTSPTPTLDALAARASGPQDALTPVPLTLPAHTTLFSGVGPRRHGVRENDSFRVAEDPAQRGFSLLAEDMRASGYRTGGFVSGQPLWRRHGLATGFQRYEQPRRDEGPQGELSFHERDAKTTTDQALAWLAQQVSGGEDRDPVFLFVHYFDPHDPYRPWQDGDPHFSEGRSRPALPPGRDGAYLLEIMRVDQQIQRLLRALPKGGEDALIIVTADHGEGLGDHGEETHGYLVHDSTVRVPFLMQLPRAQRRECDAAVPARLSDVYPTVLDVTGVRQTIETERSGRSLLDPVPPDWRHYAETIYPWYQFGYAQLLAWRDADRKLVEGGGSENLFAWREDRGETSDLAADDPAKRKALSEELRRFLRASAKGQAEEIESAGIETTSYMGARPPGAIEPEPRENRQLPRIDERWEVVRDLERALAFLRRDKANAGEAILLLSKHAAERATNPALLFWTARSHHWNGRQPKLKDEARLFHLRQAEALYLEHQERFKDSRSMDARIRVHLDRWNVTQDRAEATRAMELATGEIQTAAPRSLPLIFRALAFEILGDDEAALRDFTAALQLDRTSQRLKADVARLAHKLGR